MLFSGVIFSIAPVLIVAAAAVVVVVVVVVVAFVGGVSGCVSFF